MDVAPGSSRNPIRGLAVRRPGNQRHGVAGARAVREGTHCYDDALITPPEDPRTIELANLFRSLDEPPMIDFFELSNEMLSFANHSGYLTRVNPAWTKTLGWSAEELTSRPYLTFVHPDDVAATLQEAALLATGTHETIAFENRYRHRDGSYRWLAWSVISPPGSQDLVASVRDVTEYKIVESKLRESEERFRAFMDNNPAIAWAKDDEGRLVYLNKALQRKFGLTPEEWLGKTVFDLMPEESARPFWEDDQRVLATTEPIHVIEQTAFSEQNAKTFWLTVKFLFFDRNGKRYVGGCSVDITELKEVEQALLAERSLMRTLIDIQEKERQLLCNEFHDGIIQYAVGALMALESLDDTRGALPASPAQAEAVRYLRQGIEDGRRAIRGIRPAVLDDSGLGEALDDLVGQFANTGMHITTACDPAVGQLPEPIQTTVYRVVQEALNNAKKHSGTDNVKIDVAQVGGELQLEVRDFGRGFVFDSAVKRGFGLFGMMQRVRLLGGHCVIESQPDAGTRIAVRLPIP